MRVRCIDAGDSTWLVVGRVYEVKDVPLKEWSGWHVLRENNCLYRASQFEPIPDEPEAPDEQPKVDPYEAHRLEHDEGARADYYFNSQRNEDAFSDATARLLRGLEGEKVRERVREFPHPARNPR